MTPKLSSTSGSIGTSARGGAASSLRGRNLENLGRSIFCTRCTQEELKISWLTSSTKKEHPFREVLIDEGSFFRASEELFNPSSYESSLAEQRPVNGGLSCGGIYVWVDSFFDSLAYFQAKQTKLNHFNIPTQPSHRPTSCTAFQSTSGAMALAPRRCRSTQRRRKPLAPTSQKRSAKSTGTDLHAQRTRGKWPWKTKVFIPKSTKTLG